MTAESWRRRAGWSAVGLAILLGALALRTPEPARTALALLASVCSDRSPREREHALAEHVAGSLTFEVEDAERGWSELRYSRAELSEQLARLDATWPQCELGLDDWSVRSAGDGSEWLEGVLEFSESQARDLHAQRRNLRAQFRLAGDGRRLERVRLGAPERRLPEARP